MKNTRADGFTLVELSIVLLIIGLIIGGITAGSSIIQQAKLKAIISEIRSYNTAIDAFKVQYNSFPGDISNATTLWPSASTNNGNQNGQIEQGVPSATDDEAVLAWQHLGLAGSLSATYSGIRTGGGNNNVIGTDVPASKYGNNSGWYFDSQACYPGKNYMTLGGHVSGGTPDASLLSTVDMYNIDLKIDNGLPQTGKILSPWYDVATPGICTYNGNGYTFCVITATNSYNLTATGPLCILHNVYN